LMKDPSTMKSRSQNMELMSNHGLRAKTPKTRAGEFGNRFHWNKSDSVIEIYVPIETEVEIV